MKSIGVTSSFDPSTGITFTLTFPYFSKTLYYDPVLSSTVLEADQASDEAGLKGDDVNLRKRISKSAKNDRIAVGLLVFLAFVVAVSVTCCVKRVSFKLDLSKIIP